MANSAFTIEVDRDSLSRMLRGCHQAQTIYLGDGNIGEFCSTCKHRLYNEIGGSCIRLFKEEKSND